MDETNMLAGDAAPADTTAAATQSTDATTATDTAATSTTSADTSAKDGAATDAAAKAEDSKDAPQGAPEQYEAFTAPEGFAIDEQMLGTFAPVFKELNLSQAQAQKLVDAAPQLITPAVQAATSKVLEQVGYAGYAEWPAQVKADKELGGDKLQENLAVALKARDAFATPELRKLLETTPLGNHPEMIRFFYRAGKAISEDGFVPGGKTTTPSTAARLYSASNMNP